MDSRLRWGCEYPPSHFNGYGIVGPRDQSPIYSQSGLLSMTNHLHCSKLIGMHLFNNNTWSFPNAMLRVTLTHIINIVRNYLSHEQNRLHIIFFGYFI